MLDSKFISKPLQLFILVLASLLSYTSSLYFPQRADFVFDDSVAIVRNKDVTNLSSPLVDLFVHDFWGQNITDPVSHKSYRPLTTLMFRLENRMFGLNPVLMKLVNLWLHTTISVLLLPFFRRVFQFKDDSLGFHAALLFAIHPVHVEAVSGIVSRAELMVGVLFLVGTICYCSTIRSNLSVVKQMLKFTFVSLLQFVAILFKETGIVILPTCFFIDLVRNSSLVDFLRCRSKLTVPRSTVVRCVCAFLVTCLHVYVRLKIINFTRPIFKLQDNPLAMHSDFVVRALTQLYLYALNFWICVLPVWLSFDWAIGSIPLVLKFTDYRIVFIAVFQLTLLVLAFRLKRNILLALGCLVIPFLPAAGIVKLGFVIAERTLYIPSIGYCVLISIGYNTLLKNFKSHKKIFQYSFATLLLVFVLRTHQRATDWQTEERLFKSALNVVPGNAKAYYNIARLSTDKNDKETAFVYYKKAIELYPEYEAALMNLGNLYREIQEYELAERHLKKAIEIMEEFPAAWMNLGIVQAATKKYKNAIVSYQRALQLRKNYPNCLYNFGNLYLDLRDSTLALKYWREAIAINPKHQLAWANILALLDNQGKADSVIEISETALKHLPNETSILFSRANAMGKLGRYTDAEKIFHQIIKLRPTYALYHANLGVLYHRWSKEELAMQSYVSALRLDPDLKSARDNLMKLSSKRSRAGQ